MIRKEKTVKKSDGTKPIKTALKIAGDDLNFPIVGIGASAGGLEALELFLANVPAESGTAIVENKNWRQN